MRYQAVVFDFFGTLTHPVTNEHQREAVGPLATIIGVTVERAMAKLAESFSERCCGAWGTFEETMARFAMELGAALSSSQLEELCRVRMQLQLRHLVRLRDEAEPVLRAIRALGVPIGLLSDCTHELPMVWSTLPIAPLISTPTFSVDEGKKKPDRSLYQLTASRLGVAAEHCLYVGDGGGNELTGATDAGMTAVLLDDVVGRTAVVYDRDGWEGAAITSLTEVPALVAVDS